MSEAQCIELIVTLVTAIPSFASAISKLLEGHPSTQRVRDVLSDKSASQSALDAIEGNT